MKLHNFVPAAPRTGILLAAALAAALNACSTGSASDRGSSNGGNGANGSGGSANGVGTGGGISFEIDGGQGGSAAGTGDNCGTASADAVLQSEPVDIILVVDNSGSMQQEIDSVAANINVNFAGILQNRGVDYRVIAISRHATPTNETSLCVTAPLSSLTTCPSAHPGISERFYQFNTKVESDDSFDRILDTYIQPFGGTCPSDCNNGSSSESDGDDNSGNTEIGWSEWLRPAAKKVFLEITDANEDMTVDEFLALLTTMAPEFGTPQAPDFIFHSIVGVARKPSAGDAYLPTEPIQTANCESVTDVGETYQELSIRTGGLRFPICQFADYDVVFNRIAEDVIVRTALACDFAIPEAPDNRAVELDKVAVSYSSGGTVVASFGQAATAADCGADAFYIANDRVVLCPEACDAIAEDPQASVDVLFTCESTIILR